MSAISIGKRPLQGTSEFVSTAISFSRGVSIMRHPTTPAALHPKPMHIGSACLPQEPQRQKAGSRQKAIRGSRPRSSKKVKSGKKFVKDGTLLIRVGDKVFDATGRRVE